MIRTSTTSRGIRRFCDAIQKGRLYATTGMMQEWIRNPQGIVGASLATDNGTPVGTVLILKDRCSNSRCNIGVYVRSTHREQGVGRGMVRALLRRQPMGSNKQIYAWMDSRRSRMFYSEFGFNNCWSKL